VNDFRNKHALVTGAASGIGRATALELANQGAALSLIDRDEVGLGETETMVSRQGVRAKSFLLDVTDKKLVSAILANVESTFGTPDYLVNTAGIFCPGAIETVKDDAIQKCFSVNAFAVFYICATLVPGMMRRGSGSIVNISSLHAQNGQPHAAYYAASKGAVIAFTKSLAREKAHNGIRANVVAPGPIDTPFWRKDMVGDDADAAIQQRVKCIPLGRLGQPIDVARVTVFLLSSWASYMTGQVVTVGGGEIMP